MNTIYMLKAANYIKENLSHCLCIAVLMIMLFMVYRIVPPAADLWWGSAYYNNAGGLLQYLWEEYQLFYLHYNGRIASNFINGILEACKSHIILDLFNAVVNILIYVGIWRLCKERRRFCAGAVFYVAIIFLMSQQMRAEVLFYANSAYVVPVLLIPVYFILLVRLEENVSHAAGITAWMCLVCFMICTWMEHIAVGFGVLLTLVCGYLLIVKDRFRYHVFCTWIVSAISGLTMMLSPGLRDQRTIVSVGHTLDVVKQNVRLCEEFIIGQNIPVVLCFLIVLLIFIITNPRIGRAIKSFYVVFIGCGIVWSVLAGIYCLWGDESFRYFYESLQFSSYPRSLIISIGILTLFFGVVCAAFILSRNKMFLFGITVVCLFSLLPMLFTPNLYARVVNIGFWGIACITVILFLEIQVSDLFWKRALYLVWGITVVLSLDRTILTVRRIYTIQKQRNEILEEVRTRQMLGEWEWDREVVLPSFRSEDVLYGASTAIGTFHYPQFLYYYDLDENTLVVFEE